ncbi:MAG: cell division protein PerM [Pseudonocardiales bacterium]
MSLLLAPVSGTSVAGGHRPGRTSVGWGATVGVAFLPAVSGYLAIVALLALLGAAGGAAGGAESPLAAVARAGAVGWLVAHQVPLTIDGAPLGVLPLLPTLLLGALVARCAARVASHCDVHTPADAGWVAGAIAGTHGVLGAVLALVATPATVTADPVLAALGCALVAGVAAGLGLVRPCGLLPAALRRAPGWVRPGLLAGGWGLAVLLTAGFALVLTGLVGSAAEVVQMSGADAGSVLGLAVLSIGYLPNAVIAGLSWLAGPGFSIGALSVSPVTMQAGLVPAVPLLAALPQGPVQPWWGVALAVPLLVGAAVGRQCAAAAPDLVGRLRVLGVAAAVLALSSAVLATLAGGQLGAAAFNPIDIPAGSLAVAVLGATLLGGCAATLLSSQVAPSPADTGIDTADAADGAPPAERANGDSALQHTSSGPASECSVDAGGGEQQKPDDRQPQQRLEDNADDDEDEPDGEQRKD